MNGEKHIIWSNYNLDYEDWRVDLEAEYPDMSEEERIALMYEINSNYLDDERTNLSIQLPQPILMIADIGRWDGRYSGYGEIKSGKISDCLYSELDYATWYVDKLGVLRCDAIHHDGTNHYLYRVYKPGVRESQIDLLKKNCTKVKLPVQTLQGLPVGLAMRLPKFTGFLFQSSGKPLKFRDKEVITGWRENMKS